MTLPSQALGGQGWKKGAGSFFPAPNAQPEPCLRPSPAAGSQIQPWAELVEEFDSWDSSELVSRLFFTVNLQLELFLWRAFVWIYKEQTFLFCADQNWFLKWSRNSSSLAPTSWQNHQIVPSEDLEIKRVPCSMGVFWDHYFQFPFSLEFCHGS